MEKYGFDFQPPLEGKKNKKENLVKTSSEKDDYLTKGLQDIVDEKRRGQNDSTI